MLKKKYRKIGLVLWTDNPTHINAVDYIKRYYPHYIGILHDKDTKEDNTLKKAHWHILLYFPNQKMISTIKKELGVNDSDFYEIKSLSGQLRYLIHYDDEDKYQYSPDLIFGDRFMISKFNLAIKDLVSETEQASILYDFITSTKPTLQDLFAFALDNDLYSTFRRNYSVFRDLCTYQKLLLDKERRKIDNETRTY